MTAVAVVVAAGLVSYLLRIGAVVALGDREPPAWLRDLTPFVAPAAFAALATGALVDRASGSDGGLVAIAVVVAVVAVRATRSANAALFVGLPAVWLVVAVGGWLS